MVGVIKALVAMGVDIEVADENGKRALQHQLRAESEELAALRVEMEHKTNEVATPTGRVSGGVFFFTQTF